MQIESAGAGFLRRIEFAWFEDLEMRTDEDKSGSFLALWCERR